MKRIILCCLPGLLLAIQPQARGDVHLACPPAPYPGMAPVTWYGWGGAVGQMVPVPPAHAPAHHPHAIWYGWDGARGRMLPVDPIGPPLLVPYAEPHCPAGPALPPPPVPHQ
jgi:hypothetical protein